MALPKDMVQPAREPAPGMKAEKKAAANREEDHLAFVVRRAGSPVAGSGTTQGCAKATGLMSSAGQLRVPPGKYAQQARLLDLFAVVQEPVQKAKQERQPWAGRWSALGHARRAQWHSRRRQGATKLVHGHTHIVQEEEAVMPELRLGLQEVS